jgi:hypothetical protein
MLSLGTTYAYYASADDMSQLSVLIVGARPAGLVLGKSKTCRKSCAGRIHGL